MTYNIPVDQPFRLDLTVSALRRLPSNAVDVLTARGEYLRAFDSAVQPTVACVMQRAPGHLEVTVDGPHEPTVVVASLRRILGVDRDLSDFHECAQAIDWLAPLAARMRGLKPPRYPTLFEACINVILFQQISLHAASAIMGRLLLAVGTPLESNGVPLTLFPSVERVLAAPDSLLREAGVSAAKVATIRAVGRAIADGTLDEAMLEGQPSAEAALLLRRIPGIGPWTAAVILLRGLGRLDVFPPNDSGVAANLAAVMGTKVDPAAIAEALGPQRGMLYFCLLLSRLEARGEIGVASFTV